MFWKHRKNGVSREDMRARLRTLGLKARRNAKALTLEELAEICDLVYALGLEQREHKAD